MICLVTKSLTQLKMLRTRRKARFLVSTKWLMMSTGPKHSFYKFDYSDKRFMQLFLFQPLPERIGRNRLIHQRIYLVSTGQLEELMMNCSNTPPSALSMDQHYRCPNKNVNISRKKITSNNEQTILEANGKQEVGLNR